MKNLLHQAIDRATEGTPPKTAARMRALASVRWVLATEDGRFVTVDERARASLTTDPTTATVYDGRDNEELKLRFMEALLGAPLSVMVLD
jgi:hypothetical protein